VVKVVIVVVAVFVFGLQIVNMLVVVLPVLEAVMKIEL